MGVKNTQCALQLLSSSHSRDCAKFQSPRCAGITALTFEELHLLLCRKHMKKAVRADVGHQACNASQTQTVPRKAGPRDASISTGSIHSVGLAVSAPGSQPDPSNVAAGCGNATNLPPGFGCSKCCLEYLTCGAKVSHDNSTASLAAVPAVPAVPTEEQSIIAIDQGIPARDQDILTEDQISSAEVKGTCTKDQDIPANAQRTSSEGQGVLMSQPAPAAVDCVLPAIAENSSVAAEVAACQDGVSPSSAGQGIADWLPFEPTDTLLWLPFEPHRSP